MKWFTRHVEERFAIPGPEDVLAPGLKQVLFRYRSVCDAWMENDPSDDRAFFVNYELVTGERKRVRVPMHLWLADRYDEIIALVTKDLGTLS